MFLNNERGIQTDVSRLSANPRLVQKMSRFLSQPAMLLLKNLLILHVYLSSEGTFSHS